MSETWELEIGVNVDDPIVTLSCRRTRSASSWIKPYERVEIRLENLSEDVKEALGFLKKTPAS